MVKKPRSSFISNSKSKIPKAFLTACLTVFLLEAAVTIYDRFNPEFYGGIAVTWGYVKKLAVGQMDLSKPVLLMADSTAGVLADRLENMGIQNLALKIWDGMPAQYFLLKRYLEAGAKPKLCFFLADIRVWDLEMDTAMDHAKAADSFLRPLGSWSNAWDLFWDARRPDLAWAMLKEWVVPSRRFKIPLATLLAKARIYPVELIEKDPFADEKETMNEFERWKLKMAKTSPERMQKETLGEHYFLKIMKLCKRHNIPIVVFQAPLYPERKAEVFQYEARIARIRQFLARHRVPFYEEAFMYDKTVFDGVGSHVQTEPGRAHFADALTSYAQEWLARVKQVS